MNRINLFLRRCLFLLLLALMAISNGAAQSFEPRIVFESNHDGNWLGNWDIYSMDLNGNNLLQLTDHPAYDKFPTSSPDGKRIAFISERDLTSDLYVMDSDGNNMVRLTQDNFLEGRPSWTPDGARIAFSSFRWVVGNWEIYAMDADGQNVTRLAKHRWQDGSPSWSPDELKLRFESARDGRLNTPEHIFVMNADGSGKAQSHRRYRLNEKSVPYLVRQMEARLPFQSQHIFEGDPRYQIYAITAEGENLEKLTEEGNNWAPAYSPDGAKIAYVSQRNGDSHIFLMDTNGSNPVKLTRTPPGVDNISHPGCLRRVHLRSAQTESCRHLGEISNAPATCGNVNEARG